jgi:hypothetical protein
MEPSDLRKNKLALLGIGLLLAMIFVMVSDTPTVVHTARAARGKPPKDSCTITNPADGATVSGTVMISVEATGTPTIYIDGSAVATAYSYNWDTTGYSDGSHSIKAQYNRKRDTITVTVNNGGPPPPPPPGDKYAVVVGVSDYMDDGVGDLEYCDDDARAWKSYFTGQGYSVTCLIDRSATERACGCSS